MVRWSKPLAPDDQTSAAALRKAFVHPGQATGSSDGQYDSTPAGDLHMPSQTYPCSVCTVLHFKSEVYIHSVDPRSNLEGELDLVCCDCWCKKTTEMWNHPQWRKLCNRQWSIRDKENAKHFHKRRRSIGVQGLKLDVEAKRPEVTRKMYRRRLMDKIGLAPGFMKLRADQMPAVGAVIDHWLEEWANKVENPDYVRAMDCNTTTSSHLVEFMSQVIPGMGDYYICRQKSCSLVCKSTNWIHNRANDNRRCPACGELYNPWQALPDHWRANKVFIHDHRAQQPEQLELASGSTDGLVDKNPVMIFLILWPDTCPAVIVDRIKAIFWDIDQELFALAPTDRLSFVIKHIAIDMPHKTFELKQLSQDTKLCIDNLNASPAANTVQWQYKHIHPHGYLGTQLDVEHHLDEPIEMVDFIRIWALSAWITGLAAVRILRKPDLK
jgi:hypothetical protein